MLRGLRMMIFLAELNQLDIWAKDIGNAYLEAKTSEMVYIGAGQEFGDKEGNTLIIYKSLYGLRSSGARWDENLSDDLRDIRFSIFKVEHDIWMRQSNGLWESTIVYVDDFSFVVRDPKTIITLLEEKYKYKLKCTGSIFYHLG